MRRAFRIGLIRATLVWLAASGPGGLVQAETPASSPATAASTATSSDAAPGTPNDGKPQQFLYMLRLAPRLHDDRAWTDADKAAVSRHFAQLKEATASGRVILAGRTLEPGDRTFGLVIFEARDEADARRFMESDPAVVAGVMTATLHPYAVAMQRKSSVNSDQ